MSHHLDSPLARQDARLDITDLYVFGGQTGTVFIINVCHSRGGEVAVPGFHPEGRYEFKIRPGRRRCGSEDITYRATFDDAAAPTATSASRYIGSLDLGHRSIRFDGETSSGARPHRHRSHETRTVCGLGAGRAGDPFWIEPDVLHAVGHAIQDGTTINLGDWAPGPGRQPVHWRYRLLTGFGAALTPNSPQGGQ